MFKAKREIWFRRRQKRFQFCFVSGQCAKKAWPGTVGEKATGAAGGGRRNGVHCARIYRKSRKEAVDHQRLSARHPRAQPHAGLRPWSAYARQARAMPDISHARGADSASQIGIELRGSCRPRAVSDAGGGGRAPLARAWDRKRCRRSTACRASHARL
jgi:hypothetical protein